MNDEFVLGVFPIAWEKILQRIDATNDNTGFDREDPRTDALRRRSASVDAAAFLLGINPRVFRGYVEDVDFIEKSIAKYYSDSRVKKRTNLFVKFYWNLIGSEADSSALAAIMQASMRTAEGRVASLEHYIGSHTFLHLNREGKLFEGPIDISQDENKNLIFIHRTSHKASHSSATIDLDYRGVIVPYGNDMILFSLGANRAEPYFRIFSAQTVFDCRSQVTYGIYSGKTTADDIVFSARAALLPADIWKNVKRSSEFRSQVVAALGNNSSDNPGALVVPRSLRTIL